LCLLEDYVEFVNLLTSYQIVVFAFVAENDKPGEKLVCTLLNKKSLPGTQLNAQLD
jgi:hypothetical protein